VPARDRQRIALALLSMEEEPLSADVIPLKGRMTGRISAASDLGVSSSL
jgi:hypothetical protein